MTITKTTKLELLKPNVNELVPSFPAVNTTNMDLLDVQGKRVNQAKYGWRYIDSGTVNGVDTFDIAIPVDTFSLVRVNMYLDASELDTLHVRFNGLTVADYTSGIFEYDSQNPAVLDYNQYGDDFTSGFLARGNTAKGCLVETVFNCGRTPAADQISWQTDYGIIGSSASVHSWGRAWGYYGGNIDLSSITIFMVPATFVNTFWWVDGFVKP